MRDLTLTQKLIFQKMLVEKREKKRLSQKALAELIGVSRDSVVKWENGKRYPTLTHIGELEKVLETDLSV